jgi:5'-nucleotidase
VAKPFVVGVDLDGVCVNYTEVFRQFISQAKGIDPRTIPNPVCYDFVNDPAWPIDSREEYLELHGAAVASGIFGRAPMIEGASEALWELSNAGIYVRIITHRLLNKDGFGGVLAQTAFWLDDHDIPYRGIAFERYKMDVGADLYIDDAPGNIQELRAEGKEAAIFDATYNREVEGLRVCGWSDAVQLVRQRAGV